MKQLPTGKIVKKRKTLESRVLFIMNRLTPTNFERLAEEMRELDIHTYDDLQALVRIFFNKVTIDTKFVEVYAQLCKVMAGLKVPPPPNSIIKENQATFRVVMLTKCQQEFEADKTSIFEDPEEKRKKMEAGLPEGPERDAKIESTLYQMEMRRLKFHGNIRFIGELFKLHMLTENIMHNCICRLMRAKDDDSLLSLCILITAVGSDLDTEKARERMNQYFDEMAHIANVRKSSIRFTLKDVIDLRKNNWVPLKEQTRPKKIQDVHKDFQLEQVTKQFLQSQPLLPRTEPSKPKNRQGKRSTQGVRSLWLSDTFISSTVVSSSLHAAGGYVNGQALKRAKPLSEEEMEHKAKTILEEYLSAMDLEEAKLCVKELEDQTHISLLVTTSINDVLEKTHRERNLAGSFLHEIVKHGLLPLDVYLKGLSEVLSFAEDMVIDVPKIWTYLAQIIVPMLVGGSLSWPTLAGALKSNLDRKCCVKLVSEILLVAREKTSEREVTNMWQASNMTTSTFLETEEIAQFLRDKKLQFTVEPLVSIAVASQKNVEKLVLDVESIIHRDGTNDDVIACIDKHFIRSVVTAVVNAAISPTTKKLREDVLKSRKDVLQRYIKNKAEMELQALYAIQALVHKLEYPSGVIASIFNILYDEEVISKETFKQWEKSSDPQETEGKGACSMQLTHFFTWLQENEEPGKAPECLVMLEC